LSAQATRQQRVHEKSPRRCSRRRAKEGRRVDQTSRAALGKGKSALRRLIAAALLATGCASPGMPPGGPPDVAAPELVSVTPDTGSVGVKPKEVVFRFDEVVAERPAAATTL